MKKNILSFSELILAQCFIGSNIVIAKYLLQTFPTPLLLGFRFLTAFLVLTTLCVLHKTKVTVNKNGAPLTRQDWLTLFLQALCAGFLFNFLMISGLHYTSASTASIITSTTPAAIAIFSFLFLKEKIKRHQLIAISMAVIGLIILSLGKPYEVNFLQSLRGDVLIFLAVLPEALFTVIAKWHGAHVKPLVMALIVSLFNTLLFLPFIVMGVAHFDLTTVTSWQWFLVFIYGLSGGALFYIFWYRGLEHVSGTTAALFTTVMPISAALFAIIFLNETLSNSALVGMFFVILSIFIGTKKLSRRKPPRQTESVPEI